MYNSIVTAHATIMIFFLVMSALIGGYGSLLLTLIICCFHRSYYRFNYIIFWFILFVSIYFWPSEIFNVDVMYFIPTIKRLFSNSQAKYDRRFSNINYNLNNNSDDDIVNNTR